MIFSNQKYQGKTPLDYQCTYNFLNEGQKEKINLFWGVCINGGGRAQGNMRMRVYMKLEE
jgi:hypothetical protein